MYTLKQLEQLGHRLVELDQPNGTMIMQCGTVKTDFVMIEEYWHAADSKVIVLPPNKN